MKTSPSTRLALGAFCTALAVPLVKYKNELPALSDASKLANAALGAIANSTEAIKAGANSMFEKGTTFVFDNANFVFDNANIFANQTMPQVTQKVSDTSGFIVETGSYIINEGCNMAVEACVESPAAVALGTLGIGMIISSLSKESKEFSVKDKAVHLLSAFGGSVGLAAMANSPKVVECAKAVANNLFELLPKTSTTICQTIKGNPIANCHLVTEIDTSLIGVQVVGVIFVATLVVGLNSYYSRMRNMTPES